MEEVDRGTKPIEAVGTAVAAFIGYTERAETTKNGEKVSLVGKAQLVTNWSQYQQSFGGFIKGAYTPDAVYGYFANGGGICYIVSIKTLGTSADPSLTTPALAEVDSNDTKPTKALKFSAKEGGPVGNNIAVETKAAPPGDDGKASGEFSIC
jgi:hypothetical protein